jgi:hypothetical protein
MHLINMRFYKIIDDDDYISYILTTSKIPPKKRVEFVNEFFGYPLAKKENDIKYLKGDKEILNDDKIILSRDKKCSIIDKGPITENELGTLEKFISNITDLRDKY